MFPMSRSHPEPVLHPILGTCPSPTLLPLPHTVTTGLFFVLVRLFLFWYIH